MRIRGCGILDLWGVVGDGLEDYFGVGLEGGWLVEYIGEGGGGWFLCDY